MAFDAIFPFTLLFTPMPKHADTIHQRLNRGIANAGQHAKIAEIIRPIQSCASRATDNDTASADVQESIHGNAQLQRLAL